MSVMASAARAPATGRAGMTFLLEGWDTGISAFAPGAPTPARQRVAVRRSSGRLEVALGGRRRLEEGHVDVQDARPVGVGHGEAHVVELDGVSGVGRAAQLAEDDAADRVVGLLRQGALEALVELLHRERPLDAHPVVA